MVTNWSQRGEMGETGKTVDGESLCGKGIAGAPGRTTLELFRKKLCISQSTIYLYYKGLEHARPNISTCESLFGEHNCTVP